jgi:Extracellular link domain
MADASGNNVKIDASGNKAVPQRSETDKIWTSVFNQSNIILILWFLAIYFIAYFIMKFFYSSESSESGASSLGRILDALFLGGLLLYLIIAYFNEKDKNAYLKQIYKSSSNYLDDPSSIFTTGFFILIFYAAVYLLQLPMTSEGKPISIYLIETFVWVLFVIILFIDFFKYVLGVSITEMISKIKLWDKIPVDASGNLAKKKDASNNVVPKVDASSCLVNLESTTDEVFNVSNNEYTFNDAAAVCKIYDAKLATYDQIEKAYQKGGEWCNYGWSDGQMAFFPTQKSTWDKLQKTPNHKNDCGRPGINGGYIANPYVKFGVNCYGKKPDPNKDDLVKLNAKQNTLYPKSAEEIEMEEKIKTWKNNVRINSYNNKKWSQY